MQEKMEHIYPVARIAFGTPTKELKRFILRPQIIKTLRPYAAFAVVFGLIALFFFLFADVSTGVLFTVIASVTLSIGIRIVWEIPVPGVRFGTVLDTYDTTITETDGKTHHYTYFTIKLQDTDDQIQGVPAENRTKRPVSELNGMQVMICQFNNQENETYAVYTADQLPVSDLENTICITTPERSLRIERVPAFSNDVTQNSPRPLTLDDFTSPLQKIPFRPLTPEAWSEYVKYRKKKRRAIWLVLSGSFYAFSVLPFTNMLLSGWHAPGRLWAATVPTFIFAAITLLLRHIHYRNKCKLTVYGAIVKITHSTGYTSVPNEFSFQHEESGIVVRALEISNYFGPPSPDGMKAMLIFDSSFTLSLYPLLNTPASTE